MLSATCWQNRTVYPTCRTNSASGCQQTVAGGLWWNIAGKFSGVKYSPERKKADARRSRVGFRPWHPAGEARMPRLRPLSNDDVRESPEFDFETRSFGIHTPPRKH